MNIALISISSLRNPKEATRLTILGLAEELMRQGHSATVICEAAEGYPASEKIGNVGLYRFRTPFLSKLFFPFKGIKELQEKTGKYFDILHCFSATPLFVLSGWWAKRQARGAKLMYTLKSISKKRWANHFYALLNIADAITVPTSHFAAKLLLVNKEKIKKIASPINISFFRPLEKQKLRKKYGFSDHKIILHYGAMWEQKGTQVLLKSIPVLAERYPTVKFIFAPRYKDVDALREKVRELGIADVIQFITGDINIEEYVNLADVVVLPYLSLQGTEGNPSCLLEAMACKAPVVSTNLPEIKEITQGTVLLANPGEVESLIEKVQEALERPDEDKIKKAHLRAQDFSMKKVAAEMIEIYNK